MTDLAAIKEKLDALAVKMLDDATKEETTLDRRLDIFKFVQQYYVGSKKLNGKLPTPGDSNTPTMSELRDRVANGASAEPEEDDADE